MYMCVCLYVLTGLSTYRDLKAPTVTLAPPENLALLGHLDLQEQMEILERKENL